GDSALLIACDPVGAVSYKWYRDRNPIANSNVKRFWIYEPGNYQFTYIDSIGCESYFSPAVNITVFPIPEKPSITLSNDTLIATPGYTSYRWFLDGNLLGGSILNTWIATKEGIYQVEIIDSNQCHSVLSDTIRFIVTKNKDVFNKIRPIELIPNPVASQLLIKLNAFHESAVNWKILNAQSEVVLQGNGQAIRNSLIVDVQNLLAGFYIFIVEQEQVRSIKYFLKI
ncbi:MAG: T9SS type A sorting domain-containing protein, partial [Saprospiraceae bacterium]